MAHHTRSKPTQSMMTNLQDLIIELQVSMQHILQYNLEDSIGNFSGICFYQSLMEVMHRIFLLPLIPICTCNSFRRLSLKLNKLRQDCDEYNKYFTTASIL